MKIAQEFKVEGNIVKGRIEGNWSNDSEYALQIDKISCGHAKYDQEDLEKLVIELEEILFKIRNLNVAHANSK